MEGTCEGTLVERLLGCADVEGILLGTDVGLVVGSSDGINEGFKLGVTVGLALGF